MTSRPSTVRADARYDAAHRSVWNPAVTEPIDAHIASAIVGGEDPDGVGAAERGVGEVRQAQVGARRAHHPRHECEVVVVHEHLLALGRGLGDDGGERRVHRHVAVPRVVEVTIEPGSPGEVEEPVVEEPQHRVRDHVVVHAVQRRVQVEQAQVEPGDRRRARGDRGAVAAVDGGRDPRRLTADVVALHQWEQRADQSTGAAP